MSNASSAPNVQAAEVLKEVGKRLDEQERNRCTRMALVARATPVAALAVPLPSSVDHSAQISYVRNQGAYGCGLNACAAYWDIQFATQCAPNFVPNMSVNRMLWGWRWSTLCTPPPTIPWTGGATYLTLDQFLYNAGCATEGAELTNSDAVQWPTDAGNAECAQYRLDKHPQSFAAGYGLDSPEYQQALNDALNLYAGAPNAVDLAKALVAQDYCHHVKADVNELRYWLARGPVRISVHGRWGNHFLTLVGYDDKLARFHLINSWGDRFHDPGAEDGFGFISYAQVSQEIDSAQVYQLKPVGTPPACARIRFKSQYRQDVHLWVGWDVPAHPGTPAVRRVWPTGQRQDDSWNLSLNVALPPGFTWPPSPTHRVFLDVYDCGAHSDAGGTIEDFTVGWAGQFFYCGDLVQGTPDANPLGGPHDHPLVSGRAKAFKPRTMTRLTIP